MSNYYTKTETDSKITNIKKEYSSIFGAPREIVGDSSRIADGTYNVNWIIYTISGNTYQLFPLKSLNAHRMNPTDTNSGGYTGSEMYTYIHNTVLPNLKRSGLNIISCDLISEEVYDDICSKTGKTSATIAGGEGFWFTDPTGRDCFYIIDKDGKVSWTNASNIIIGVRPLITVVK